MRPSRMTATRSATASASSWSCVTNTVVMPSSVWMRRISSRSCTRTFGVEGTERLVEQQHARARDEGAGERDALLLPARELVGEAIAVLGRGRRCRKDSRARSRRRAAATLRIRSPNSTFSSTVMCGNSEYDWNTMPMSRLLVGVSATSGRR